MLQIMFQSYFVTAGRPHLGLWATVGAGLLNAVLDYLFIVPLGMGVAGAALATIISQALSAVLCVIHLAKKGTIYQLKLSALRGTVYRR